MNTVTSVPQNNARVLGQDDLWSPLSHVTWNCYSPTMLKPASGLGSLFADFSPLLGPPQQADTRGDWISGWTGFSFRMLLGPRVNQWMQAGLGEMGHHLPLLNRARWAWPMPLLLFSHHCSFCLVLCMWWVPFCFGDLALTFPLLGYPLLTIHSFKPQLNYNLLGEPVSQPVVYCPL